MNKEQVILTHWDCKGSDCGHDKAYHYDDGRGGCDCSGCDCLKFRCESPEERLDLLEQKLEELASVIWKSQ